LVARAVWDREAAGSNPVSPTMLPMMKPTIIYIVRHGESEANRDNIISGQIDPALTEAGRAQARETKAALSHVKFDAVYSSDLQRAAETAGIIFGQAVPAHRQKVNFRERNFGTVDGKPGHHLEGLHEKMLSMAADESLNYKPVPGMESDNEVADRFIAELEQIARVHGGQTILVGAHGGTIRTTLVRLQNLRYSDMPQGSFKNAGYAKLTYADGKFTVDEVVGVDKQLAG
jgi:broad specificity phosphatase PhoE